MTTISNIIEQTAIRINQGVQYKFVKYTDTANRVQCALFKRENNSRVWQNEGIIKDNEKSSLPPKVLELGNDYFAAA